MSLTRQRFSVVLIAGLVGAACGGSGDDAATPASTTPASDAVGAPTSIPTTSAVATSAVATTTTAATVLDETATDPSPRFVVAALAEPPDARGWPLSSGSWQSSVFDPPLAFETRTDLSLISQSPEAIVLTESGADRDARLTILVPLAVGGDDNVPTAVPDDFETYLRGVDSIDIRAIREFTRDDGALMMEADFTAHEPVGHTKFACSIGLECLWLMKTSAGEDVHAIEGAPIRVVATEVGGVPVRVVASALDRDTFDRLATEAHHIAASFSMTNDQPPENSRIFLATLGSRARSIPPGIWVARLGDHIVELEIDADVEGVAVDHIGSNTILFDIADLGVFYIAQPLGMADPDAPQRVVGMTIDDVTDPPRSVFEYEEWLEQMVVVTGRSSSMVGGSAATTWTTEIDDSVDHYTCGPPMRPVTGGRCVSLFTTELGFWSSSDSDGPGIDYYLDETGIHIGGSPTDPDRLDEFERVVGPLLDSIRIVG